MKKITGLDDKQNLTGVEMTPQKLLLLAIDNHEPLLKGLENISKAIKLREKIESAGSEIELEDSEFETVFSAFNAMQWGNGILRFSKFVEQIQELHRTK